MRLLAKTPERQQGDAASSELPEVLAALPNRFLQLVGIGSSSAGSGLQKACTGLQHRSCPCCALVSVVHAAAFRMDA